MPPRLRRWLPGILSAILLAACGGLAWLQYRWIGELGRAEAGRFQANLRGQGEAFARAFDRELSQAVLSYLPAARDYAEADWRQAHANKALAAISRQVRPMFARIAVAHPVGSANLELYFLDLRSGALTLSPWPEEWLGLRVGMLGALTGGPKPLDGVEPGSAVIEAPILDGPRELGWMIFEVDAEYARRQWFPDLIAAHLNPGPDDPLSLRILGPERNGEPIYSVNPAPGPPDAVIPFFPQRFPDFAPGPRFGPGGRKGPPPGARKGPARPGRPGPPGRWLLEIRAGQRGVDATVNRVRNRNLALSLTLLGLIGVSGLLLIRATFRARRLAELQFQFLAGVSHELRTPLAIIRGAAHNLLTGIVPHEERRRAYLQAIATNSTQLGDMVEQLLAYAKARQEGKTELEPVEVSAAVSEALESLTYELEASGAQLDLDLPATLPLVWADPAGLRRALLNLIANAAKHGGRQIAISAREAAPFVEIRVADDGEGIPPEEAARIFEPFFRGERARSSKIRGTGLGLSLVQQIAAAAGGEVALESPPGQGAAFILRLRTEAPKR